MRMRKKKHGAERLDSCVGFWIENPTEYKNNWQSVFLKHAPLFIEIGCGKGGFIVEMAKLSPDKNFVAVEYNTDVLMLAAEKVKEEELYNVKLINFNAKNLSEVFGEGECSGIYLNFSDPWHKNPYQKNRLTHEAFLDIYKSILKKGSEIRFKTDNKRLFDFSLWSFGQNGFDVAVGDFNVDAVTEYEMKFIAQGKDIYKATLTV